MAVQRHIARTLSPNFHNFEPHINIEHDAVALPKNSMNIIDVIGQLLPKGMPRGSGPTATYLDHFINPSTYITHSKYITI
jgi:hypothetical protein